MGGGPGRHQMKFQSLVPAARRAEGAGGGLDGGRGGWSSGLGAWARSLSAWALPLCPVPQAWTLPSSLALLSFSLAPGTAPGLGGWAGATPVTGGSAFFLSLINNAAGGGASPRPPVALAMFHLRDGWRFAEGPLCVGVLLRVKLLPGEQV